MTQRFDYIVVGSGSAGATLAIRLAQAEKTVLLLEAGPAKDEDFWVRVPIGIAKILANPDYVWKFNRDKASTGRGAACRVVQAVLSRWRSSRPLVYAECFD